MFIPGLLWLLQRSIVQKAPCACSPVAAALPALFQPGPPAASPPRPRPRPRCGQPARAEAGGAAAGFRWGAKGHRAAEGGWESSGQLGKEGRRGGLGGPRRLVPAGPPSPDPPPGLRPMPLGQSRPAATPPGRRQPAGAAGSPPPPPRPFLEGRAPSALSGRPAGGCRAPPLPGHVGPEAAGEPAIRGAGGVCVCVSSPPPSAFPHVHARGLDLSARTGPRPRPRKHPRGAGGEGSPEEMPRSVPRPRRQPRPPAAPLPAPARPPLPLSRGAPERRQPSASAGAALPHPALPSPPKAEKDVFPAQPPQGSRSPNALAELLSCSLGGERCSQGGKKGGESVTGHFQSLATHSGG